MPPGRFYIRGNIGIKSTITKNDFILSKRIDKLVSIWYTILINTNILNNPRHEVKIMGNMSFVSFRELRTSTAKINDMLTDNGKIVVTSNGKPKALMIQVSETDFEETLAVLNQVRLTRILSKIRAAAQQSGASEMTLDEINAEIAAARQERREKSVKGEENA